MNDPTMYTELRKYCTSLNCHLKWITLNWKLVLAVILSYGHEHNEIMALATLGQ